MAPGVDKSAQNGAGVHLILDKTVPVNTGTVLR
jgi:hypothetical protein